MTMVWNDRSSNSLFVQHNEHMSAFRKSHADIALINAPRLAGAALIENMELLPSSSIIWETGGLLFPSSTEWEALVPLWRVARYKLANN